LCGNLNKEGWYKNLIFEKYLDEMSKKIFTIIFEVINSKYWISEFAKHMDSSVSKFERKGL